MAAFVQLLVVLYVSLTRIALGDDSHGANALSYDAETFSTGLEGSRNFVMFYAPWCGHCKNLAPTWDELAKIYNRAEDSPVVIAKVDCTVHTELCANHEVVGFPTLKLFDVGGVNHKRYSGKRDLESLKNFIQEQLHGVGFEHEEPAKTAEEHETEPPVQGTQLNVVVLTDETFIDSVQKGLFFIKFYAPWCGHCQRLVPTWNDLAETFRDYKVSIANIDCTKSSIICKQYEINGYPTLLWFKDGEKTDLYQGSRSHEALKKYVADKLSAVAGELHGHEEERVPDAVQDSDSLGHVNDLTDETFRSHISSGLVFVKFFAPWCGHCKRLAPTWEDLAKEFRDSPVSIAKVDCTQYKTVCDENQVRGYPTLKIFRDGDFVRDYKGARTLEDLHEFVKKHLEGRHDEL